MLRPAPPLARIVALGAIVLVVAACSSSAAGRPATPATLQIVSPTPDQVTGSDVDLRLQLEHAKVVPATQAGGKIRPDEGHVHVSVDGQLVSMTYGLEQSVPGLAPGPHTIQAEFVAADHLAFSNRVVAAVTFRVG